MNLLVIDWDYFFPSPGDDPLFDWGHSESSEIYHDVIWTARAAGLQSAGRALPMTTGQEHTFWQRFRISRSATVYIADSNVQACAPAVMQRVRHVWLYDAHHDSGYRGRADLRSLTRVGEFTCENWTIAYWLKRATIHMRYPSWRSYALDLEPEPPIDVDRQVDDGAPVPEMFSRIFICRSSAWVPPWLDTAFTTFVQRSGRRVKKLHPFSEREWSDERQAQVRTLAEQMISQSHTQRRSNV